MTTKAHVTFKGDAICGADLTGKSPDGLPSCQDCLGVMFDWLVAHDIDTAHAVALERAAWVAWLVEVVAFPFDFTFTTPPPVDPDEVADYWRTSDGWDCTQDEARAMVRGEGWPIESGARDGGES